MITRLHHCPLQNCHVLNGWNCVNVYPREWTWWSVTKCMARKRCAFVPLTLFGLFAAIDRLRLRYKGPKPKFQIFKTQTFKDSLRHNFFLFQRASSHGAVGAIENGATSSNSAKGSRSRAKSTPPNPSEKADEEKKRIAEIDAGIEVIPEGNNSTAGDSVQVNIYSWHTKKYGKLSRVTFLFLMKVKTKGNFFTFIEKWEK